MLLTFRGVHPESILQRRVRAPPPQDPGAGARGPHFVKESFISYLTDLTCLCLGSHQSVSQLRACPAHSSLSPQCTGCTPSAGPLTFQHHGQTWPLAGSPRQCLWRKKQQREGLPRLAHCPPRSEWTPLCKAVRDALGRWLCPGPAVFSFFLKNTHFHHMHTVYSRSCGPTDSAPGTPSSLLFPGLCLDRGA